MESRAPEVLQISQRSLCSESEKEKAYLILAPPRSLLIHRPWKARMVVGHIDGRLLDFFQGLANKAMVVMTVDTEQSFAVDADLVSRESGLRRLIEMSGS